MISVCPNVLVEVISLMPAILPNVRSSGVATVAAMVSGLAPGSWARTRMVGKSTWGRGATGRKRKATMPDSRIARVTRTVATGLRMKVSEKFMPVPHQLACAFSVSGGVSFLNRLESLSK